MHNLRAFCECATQIPAYITSIYVPYQITQKINDIILYVCLHVYVYCICFGCKIQYKCLVDVWNCTVFSLWGDIVNGIS